jgi:hypothetical protein
LQGGERDVDDDLGRLTALVGEAGGVQRRLGEGTERVGEAVRSWPRVGQAVGSGRMGRGKGVHRSTKDRSGLGVEVEDGAARAVRTDGPLPRVPRTGGGLLAFEDRTPVWVERVAQVAGNAFERVRVQSLGVLDQERLGPAHHVGRAGPGDLLGGHGHDSGSAARDPPGGQCWRGGRQVSVEGRGQGDLLLRLTGMDAASGLEPGQGIRGAGGHCRAAAVDLPGGRQAPDLSEDLLPDPAQLQRLGV